MQKAKGSCPFAGSTHLIKRLLQIVSENNTAFHYAGAASIMLHIVQRCAVPYPGSIRHYFPSLGRHTNRRLAPPSGNLTPPRIAPRCPHQNGWTQSTIIGLRDHCETACQGCFGLGGPALHLSRPSSFIDLQREKNLSANSTGGPRAPAASLPPLVREPVS